MNILKAVIFVVILLAICLAVALGGGSGSVRVGGVPLFLLCASVGFLLHWVGFIPAFLFQTERWFDLVGAASFLGTLALALAFHPSLDARGMLLGLLIALWAVRLGSFLFLRVMRAGGDRRFDEIKPRFWRFLRAWTLGGAWVLLTIAAGLAAITSMEQQRPGLFAGIGAALWIIGFAIEVLADRQKTQFRRDPRNADRFITTGLWAWSRHPNYFGEIVLWVGVAIIALPVLSGWQYLTLLSPLFVVLVLTRVSGVRLLELDGEKRWGSDPDYQDYLKATPVLIPWPGKSRQMARPAP